MAYAATAVGSSIETARAGVLALQSALVWLVGESVEIDLHEPLKLECPRSRLSGIFATGCGCAGVMPLLGCGSWAI